MLLTRPAMRWGYDAKLAMEEAFRMIVTGDSNIRPMDQVVEVDRIWERTVMTDYALLKFHIDYSKRPLEMQ